MYYVVEQFLEKTDLSSSFADKLHISLHACTYNFNEIFCSRESIQPG